MVYYDYHDKMAIAHGKISSNPIYDLYFTYQHKLSFLSLSFYLTAICGSLASLIVIPTAILIARNRNKLHSNSLNWFKLHSSLNYLGAILLVITFVLGVGAVASAGLGNQFSGPNSLVLLFILVFGKHMVRFERGKELNLVN